MWSPLGEGSHARHQSQLKPFILHIGHKVPSPPVEQASSLHAARMAAPLERDRVRGRTAAPRLGQALTPTLSRYAGEGERSAGEGSEALPLSSVVSPGSQPTLPAMPATRVVNFICLTTLVDTL